MHKKILIFIFLFFLDNANFAEALDVLGKQIQEKSLIGDKTLVLNGVGIRKATIFKIKVYVAALYLLERTSDADKIVSSSGEKILDLHFIRSVSREKIVSAWNEGFEKQGSIDTAGKDFISNLDKLNSSMSDLEDGDILRFVFHESEVEVIKNNKIIAKLSGGLFAKKLLLIWLGDFPPNKELKTGLLKSIEHD